MPVDVIVPAVGESIHEVQIAQWLKSEGEWVEKDENLVEVETDKATVQLPAPSAGRLTKVLKQPGEMAEVGQVIATLDETADEQAEAADQAAEPTQSGTSLRDVNDLADNETTPTAEPVASPPPGPMKPEPRQPSAAPAQQPAARTTSVAPRAATPADPELEEVVPMSMIRRRIAERLVEAQQNAALLTTFNEVDMSEVLDLRAKFKEAFQERYGAKLGFMSFFVKAAIEALKRFPQVNAEIRGQDIVFRNHYDIGIAVGGGKGLVVPVLRRAELLSFAEIEQQIVQFAARAQENKLAPADLQGGTFTISNGGIYGSLLSTPIVNPPQSGILGLHAIQDRPVARDKQVVIRPMMYLALTYDHRLVDGREAVGFLRTVKEVIEDPTRLLLEI